MRRLGILFFLAISTPVRSETGITLDDPMPPPAWALAQRALLEANAEEAQRLTGRYMDERGWLAITPNWGGMDGADDVMERFRHWPLLYILGGSESVLTTYKKIWEGHLQQYTEARELLVEVAREGMYYREFCPSFDWEHIGEGMAGWYWYGLARPRDLGYRIRARRFSSFYMNEDPSAPNYDPEHKIIRSLFNGSPVHARDVVVQTGGYAEHRCLSVNHGGRATQVDDSHFRVRLEPGSGGRLVLTLERYSRTPTLAFPWDR